MPRDKQPEASELDERSRARGDRHDPDDPKTDEPGLEDGKDDEREPVSRRTILDEDVVVHDIMEELDLDDLRLMEGPDA